MVIYDTSIICQAKDCGHSIISGEVIRRLQAVPGNGACLYELAQAVRATGLISALPVRRTGKMVFSVAGQYEILRAQCVTVCTLVVLYLWMSTLRWHQLLNVTPYSQWCREREAFEPKGLNVVLLDAHRKLVVV